MLGEHATRAHAGTRHISHGEHAPLAYSASRSLSQSLTPALRFSLPSISFPHHFLASFCRAQMHSARTCFYFASSAPSVPRGIPFFISLSRSRDFIFFLQRSLERFFVAFYVVLFVTHLRLYTRHACFCSDFLSCFLFYLFYYSFCSWSSIHRLLYFLPFTFLSSFAFRTVSSYASYIFRLTPSRVVYFLVCEICISCRFEFIARVHSNLSRVFYSYLERRDRLCVFAMLQLYNCTHKSYITHTCTYMHKVLL